MEDKTFELLTKMYSEMTEQFKEVNRKLDGKAEKSDIIRLENNHGEKLDSLFDGYKQLAEGQQEIKEQLSDIRSRVANQEIELTVLKSVK